MRTRPIQNSSDPASSHDNADPIAVKQQVPSTAKATEGTHRSVLLQEAIEVLEIVKDDTVLDATLGGAGHAVEIVKRLGEKGTFVGFDLDHDAIERTRVALDGSACRIELFEANFRTMASALPARNIAHIDKALFDLGWSSFQLQAGRGFSFNTDEPLEMTYSKQAGAALNAATIVNSWKEHSIADVVFGWGEDHFSRQIARKIVEQREVKPFTTARELAECIREAVPSRFRYGKIHPATKTFQALRIAVNDELGSLTDGLHAAWSLLSEGGKIAVISFHSIEDRIVKRHFATLEKEGTGKRMTKKPLVASAEELAKNPRARSAKLRIIQKISKENI